MGFLYKRRSKLEQSESLVRYLPSDMLFCAKNVIGSTLRKLIDGLSRVVFRTDNTINDVAFQHDVRNTNDFITEWETAVGIPDNCFPNTDTLPIEDRRHQVLIKMLMRNTHTKEDYIRLAQFIIPGLQIQITYPPPPVLFPIGFPLQFSLSTEAARFVMIVRLPVSLEPGVFPFNEKFPIPFSSGGGNIIECVFRQLQPAAYVYEFVYDL